MGPTGYTWFLRVSFSFFEFSFWRELDWKKIWKTFTLLKSSNLHVLFLKWTKGCIHFWNFPFYQLYWIFFSLSYLNEIILYFYPLLLTTTPLIFVSKHPLPSVNTPQGYCSCVETYNSSNQTNVIHVCFKIINSTKDMQSW